MERGGTPPLRPLPYLSIYSLAVPTHFFFQVNCRLFSLIITFLIKGTVWRLHCIGTLPSVLRRILSPAFRSESALPSAVFASLRRDVYVFSRFLSVCQVFPPVSLPKWTLRHSQRPKTTTPPRRESGVLPLTLQLRSRPQKRTQTIYRSTTSPDNSQIFSHLFPPKIRCLRCSP